jgi:hypothetical protein
MKVHYDPPLFDEIKARVDAVLAGGNRITYIELTMDEIASLRRSGHVVVDRQSMWSSFLSFTLLGYPVEVVK